MVPAQRRQVVIRLPAVTVRTGPKENRGDAGRPGKPRRPLVAHSAIERGFARGTASIGRLRHRSERGTDEPAQDAQSAKK